MLASEVTLAVQLITGSLIRRGLWAMGPRLRRLLVRIGLRFLPTSSDYPIELAAFSARGDPQHLFERIGDALTLIQLHDPRRLARMQRYVKRLALVQSGGEIYDHDLQTYIVDAPLLERRQSIEIAMAIVHEATHARLRHCGIQTTEANQARIEALCVKEEIAFATRVPHSSRYIAHARQKVLTPWWGKKEGDRRTENQLSSLRIPEWIIRIRHRFTRP